MTTAMAREFVVCLRNDGAEDLDVRRVYAVLPDEDAASNGFLRVIDESGEDYLYPAEFFAFVDVPEDAARELRESRAQR